MKQVIILTLIAGAVAFAAPVEDNKTPAPAQQACTPAGAKADDPTIALRDRREALR
jgi:hypothetical protein